MSEPPIRELLVVARNYPSPAHPTYGTFVRAMIEAFVAAGISATVISPQKPWQVGAETDETPAGAPDGRTLRVRRPGFLPLSNKRLGPFSTLQAGQWSFDKAVRRASRGLYPQAVYSHFLFPSAAGGLRVADRLGVPSFVAMGEGNPGYYLEHFGLARTRQVLTAQRGVLAASPDNRDFCVDTLAFPPERILTLPNAADPERFHPRDRAAMRRKHGLPLDRTVAIFVGHFDENKGARRLAAALDRVPGVDGVFLGDGELVPEGESVLKAGKVPHDEVPEWLSAADFFALPTLRECSSNALAEAVASGLPVLSSDIANTRAMVDPSWSLLVDPADVESIAEGVRRITADSERLRAMGAAALEHGRRNGIQARARRVLDWMAALT